MSSVNYFNFIQLKCQRMALSCAFQTSKIVFFNAEVFFYSLNACVSRSACVGRLCAIKGAQRAAHKRTARALSAARTCYAYVAV